MRPVQEKWSHGLMLAATISLLFMALSFLRTWGDVLSALLHGQVIETTLDQPIWGTRLGLRLFGFIGALVIVHLALGLCSWVAAHASRIAFPNSRNGLRSWTLLWVLVLCGWTLLANAAWFPYSALGGPYHRFARLAVGPIDVLLVATILLVVLLGYVLSSAAARTFLRFGSRRRVVVGLAALPVVIALLPSFGLQASRVTTPSAMPHVIIIGIDSLRPDFVLSETDELTPAIDDFLSRSVMFTDTTTPLARTFPAWVSIVSGRHPHSTGAIINLFPRHLIDEGETLPRTLQRAGYRTVYGIDEVRFSNLDTSYGFESMIAPPIGSADFLLGYVYDFPLANLVVNTSIGRTLFPFTHANRAAAVTYDPDAYVRRIGDEVDFDQPTLLSVHLTLPHWPYIWASAPKVSAETPEERLLKRYRLTIERVDEQFRYLVDTLEKRGALENAIVVLLSDHGESLGEMDTVPPGADANPVYGHGTNVLAREQYQVVLGMRAFGNDLIGVEGAPRFDIPVSLEDIAPTIVDLLGLETTQDYDGRSLLSFLAGGEQDESEWHDRIRFTETEYNPPGFTGSGSPGARQLAEAAKFYEVDSKTDRLTVRPQLIDTLLEQRQYAASNGDSMIATLPAEVNGKQLLVYRHADEPDVWLGGAPDPSRLPEARRLFDALINRFDDIDERSIALPSDSGR